MNCKKLQAKLLAYLDRELPENLNHLIENHLKTCPNCQKEFEAIKKTVDLFRQLPEIELKPEQQERFLTEVRNKLHRIKTQPFPRKEIRWLLPRLVPALAGAIFLILLVVSKYKKSDTEITNQLSNIFLSPSFCLSGKFVSDYFAINEHQNGLREEASRFDSESLAEIERYLNDQMAISDLIQDLTKNELSGLVQEIKEKL